MIAVFNEDKKRELNKFNKRSVKVRYDIDDIENYESAIFYDDLGNIVLDAEFYCPQDKAYIFLNRVHFGDNYKDKQKEAFEQFIGYILCYTNLNYIASAIYVDIVGFSISEDLALEIGFFPVSGALYAILNWNFEEELTTQDIDPEIKKTIIKDYLVLKSKKLAHMDFIRSQLKQAKEHLSFFQAENTNDVMIKCKEIEVQHLERILRSSESNK